MQSAENNNLSLLTEMNQITPLLVDIICASIVFDEYPEAYGKHVKDILKLALEYPTVGMILGDNDKINEFIVTLKDTTKQTLVLYWSRLSVQLTDEQIEWLMVRWVETSKVHYTGGYTTLNSEVMLGVLKANPYLLIMFIMELFTVEQLKALDRSVVA